MKFLVSFFSWARESAWITGDHFVNCQEEMDYQQPSAWKCSGHFCAPCLSHWSVRFILLELFGRKMQCMKSRDLKGLRLSPCSVWSFPCLSRAPDEQPTCHFLPLGHTFNTDPDCPRFYFVFWNTLPSHFSQSPGYLALQSMKLAHLQISCPPSSMPCTQELLSNCPLH